MAEDVGSLYLRLGLNLSELETGFVTASQTVAANISRLNREAELIKIRAQVEMEGLDEVADADRILEIRQNTLNQQMAIQRDRVRILNAALEELSQTQGESSIAAQRASIRLERERLALARLESEIRDVTSAISELNSTDIDVSGTASISGGAGGSGGSGGGSGSGGGDWTDLLPFELPTTKVAALGVAIGALGAAVEKTTELVTEALDDFRETQKQSYELNLDYNDAEQLLREMRLAGGDIGDFEGFIRGITDAYVKGEYDDPEFIALRRYGAKITDATGRLKNFAEITDEVYEAWKKADEEGNGIEFLQMVGGESGIRDAIQYFKRLEEAREDAERLVDANLDPEQWHEFERSMNLLSEQTDEFKEGIANIFTPAAQASAEKFFNLFHDATEWLVENKDEIQRWGFIATEVLDELAPKFESLLPSGQLQSALETFKKIFDDISNVQLDLDDDKANETLGKLQTDAEKLYSESPLNKLWDNIFDSDLFKDNVFTQAVKRAEEAQKEFNGELEESNTVAGKVAKGLEALSDKHKEHADVLSQYGAQRIEQFKDELEDLQIELDFGDNDYAKSIAQLKLWEDRELHDKNFVSDAETEAITKLAEAKRALIDQERDDKLAEIRQRISAAERTEVENRMIAIEDEKDKWIAAGMAREEAEQLAEQQKSSYIRSVEEELSASIDALHQTDLQKKLAQIEAEKQAWISKGASVAQAEQLAQAKIEQANQETADRLNGIRESVASLFRSDIENRIAEIEREKNAWIQAGMERAEAEELAQQKIQAVRAQAEEKDQQKAQQIAKAKEDYEKSLAQAQKQYIQQVQAAREEADRKNKAALDEAFNILESKAKEFEVFLKEGVEGLYKLKYDELIQKGVSPNTLAQMTPANLDAYKNAVEEAKRKLLPNWYDQYEPRDVQRPEVKMPDIFTQSANQTAKKFSELQESADRAAKSLDNLAGGSTAEGSGRDDYAPERGNPVGAYEKPDGSLLLTNSPSANEHEFDEHSGSDDDYSLGNELPENFSELQTAVQSSVEALGELPTAVQGITQSLSEIPSPEYETSFGDSGYENGDSLVDLSEGFTEVTSRIDNLVQVITETAARKEPVAVNTTIQIDEAHAWDYDHIQELAERVAEILQPTIVNAIGGDSNSY